MLNHWNRLKELEAFQHGLDSLLSRSPAHRTVSQAAPGAAVEWSPLVDISEDDKEYLIMVELPEVKKEDVTVMAEIGTLTIMGERKFEGEQEGRRSHRIERSYGSFGRLHMLLPKRTLCDSQH
jgi:HSP20 family protein